MWLSNKRGWNSQTLSHDILIDVSKCWPKIGVGKVQCLGFKFIHCNKTNPSKINLFYSKSSLKENTLSASTKFKFVQQISLKNEVGIQKVELKESLKPSIKLIKVQVVLTFEETEQMF